MPVFWIGFGAVVFLGASFYFYFFFPNFQVQILQISGNQKIQTIQIEDLAWQRIDKKLLGLPYKSIFTINTQTIKKALLTGFPILENVDIQKSYFDKIIIQVTEREPFAVFCPNQAVSDCFTIDKNGVIYENMQNPADGNFILRQNIGQTVLQTGQHLIDKNSMDGIFKIRSNLKNSFQVDLKEALVSNPLIVTTAENWKIYFNPEADINLQIMKMNALLNDEISLAARKNLEYIYLQYKDRAYYK